MEYFGDSIDIWKVEGNHLLYHQGDGLYSRPSAMQIWSSIYGKNEEFKVKPHHALPAYEFSRYPAVLELLLSGRTPDSIRVDLACKSGNELFPVGNGFSDQLVLGNTWFPVPVQDYEDCLKELEKMDIVSGREITVGQFIWLKSRVNFGIDIVDRVETSSPAATSAPPSMNPTEWGLKAELYGYQRDGVFFLTTMAKQGFGCILGDEMGLGKTIQVISLMLSERSQGRGPSLIVAPVTLLENWRRELLQFAPSLRVIVHAGPGRAGIVSRLTGADVVVTSYDTAVMDEPMLSGISWNLLGLDEAQYIKNPDAQRTVAVKNMPRKISVAVTGTPVENRLTDLWSLSDFVLPGLLGKQADFERLFDNSNSDASQLAPLVSPILLRRRVKDVAQDLPERIDIPQPVVMSKRMGEMYEEVRLMAVEEYGKSASLVSLQKLRMFCTHPDLAGYSSGDPAEQMPKYQRLTELLEEIFSRNQKCLVFTSYIGMTDIFLEDLPKRFQGLYFNFIDGRVSVEDRQPLVDEFSAAPCGGALILNPRAAGVGLNITAANHVIHYNPEWNPAIVDQASARAYRRKQKLPVTIHQLYFVDSVEEVVFGRLALKRDLSEHAAKGNTGDATASEIMQALRMSPLSRLGGLE